jgi:hypothetical protein
LLHEKIKSRLNSYNAFYLSLHDSSFYRLLSKNLNMKIYKTLTLTSLLWRRNLIFKSREENRLRIFETRKLRRVFGPKTKEVAGG